MPKPLNAERERVIGARIALARVLAGLSRPALGGRIGVTYAMVAKYERGEVRVPASMLEGLGAALACGAASFLVTDLDAVARAELVALPSAGSVARRHLDAALAALGLDRSRPFSPAAPAGQPGSATA